MASFTKINTTASRNKNSLLSKIASMIESAESSGLFDPSSSFLSSIENTLADKKETIIKENCIPYDYAIQSGLFQSQGLGVFTCSENGVLRIWRVVNSEKGPVIVRDEELEEENNLINKLLANTNE